MSNPTRPLAQQQRRIIGTAVLRDIGTAVSLTAMATDLFTGQTFYIVDGPRPFGVWPSELSDIRFAMPING